MVSGARYRVVSAGGAALVTAVAAWVANHPLLQWALASVVPILNRLNPEVLPGDALLIAVGTTLVVVLAALLPLFKPRPRRILDTIMLTQKRIVIAGFALAAIGYFDYTYRLPRTTLVLVTAVLLFALPAWFVSIRRRPRAAERAIIVGDDPETMADVFEASTLSLIGYVSPHSPFATATGRENRSHVTDGGVTVNARSLGGLPFLGGLSNLDEVLVDHDVDTALLAFSRADRAEFFGALDTCYDHGVSVKVHRDHADTVLIDGGEGGQLVDVELEPWDWQDYVLKRTFDVIFSMSSLMILSPIILVIVAAVKMEDGSPILYSQQRTAAFGETFTVWKFRTMLSGSEDSEPIDDEKNNRITRVGRVLRKTHFDELPQLWSILIGDMSVVGPRAVWTKEEQLLDGQIKSWRRRWFVKPGLTGLAQINGASSTDARQKLRYDIEYISEQSFWLDLKIVIRQLWGVAGDVAVLLRNREE